MLTQTFPLNYRLAASLSIMHSYMYLKNIYLLFIFFRLTVKCNIYLLTDQGCLKLIKKEEGDEREKEKENGMLLTEYVKIFEQKFLFFINQIIL